MATNIVRKIKNYLLLPKLTTAERDTYEQIRQEICTFPQSLSQITEKINPLGNDYDVAYCLDSNIKLIVAQYSNVKEVQLPFKPFFAYPTFVRYECHVTMPNGQYIDLVNTKRAKLLLNQARKKGKIHNNKIDTNSYHGISDYIEIFREKHNMR